MIPRERISTKVDGDKWESVREQEKQSSGEVEILASHARRVLVQAPGYP